MTNREVRSHAVWPGSRLHIHRDRDDQPSYITGEVLTKWGYVSVYAQGWRGDYEATRVSFIWREREYTRNYDRRLSERGIAIVGRRFARDVAAGKYTNISRKR